MPVCEVLASSDVLPWLQWTFTLLSAAAVALNLALLPLAVVQRSLHANIRLLLANYCVVCVYVGVCGLHLSVVYKSLAQGTLTDDCRLESVSWTTTLHIVGIIAMSVGQIIMALERAIATKLVATYEKKTRIWIGVLLATAQWVLPLLMTRTILVESATGLRGNASLPRRDFGLPEAKTMFGKVVGGFGMEVIGTSIFVAVALINRRKQRTTYINRALHNLTTRYQIAENIRATRMLLASAIWHLAAFWPSYAIMMVLVNFPAPFEDYRHPHFLIAANTRVFSQLFASLFAVGFPIVIFFFSVNLRKTALTQMRRTGLVKVEPQAVTVHARPDAAARQSEAERHMQAIAEAWNHNP